VTLPAPEAGEPEPCLVSIDVFEGPLDLLLYLIRKHELDIMDIPVAFVAERYLDYISAMRELQLDVAADYLEMAATLAHLKSLMLLPEPPQEQAEEEEEKGDPREELVRRLLEYKKYKEAARELHGAATLGRDTFTGGTETPAPKGARVESDVTLFELVELAAGLIEKARTRGMEGPQITADRISVAERIAEIADALKAAGAAGVSFAALVGETATVFDVVVTFLALLEMARLRMISLGQREAGGGITIAGPLAYEMRAEEPPPPPEAGASGGEEEAAAQEQGQPAAGAADGGGTQEQAPPQPEEGKSKADEVAEELNALLGGLVSEVKRSDDA